MLVLTRRSGESIVVLAECGPVYVEVLTIRGQQVRLGIRAPRAVEVHRNEVFTRQQQRIGGGA